MVPAVLWVGRHLASDFVKDSTLFISISLYLTEPVIETLARAQDVLRYRAANILIHVFDIVDIVHVVGESSHKLWDLSLGFLDHCVDKLLDLLVGALLFECDTLKQGDYPVESFFCSFCHDGAGAPPAV